MTANVGVLLSGCGFLDGSEITEAVLTLLALDQQGATAICMAPRGPQAAVVDHARGEPVTGAARDVLTEAARIARGRIRDLADVKAAELDALVLPGGFGAAKNLCDFATKGAAATPQPQVARLLREMHAAGKPIGAICIAPALVAAVFGRSLAPTLTVGADGEAAAAIVAMGARHRPSPVTECVVDARNRIVTTPAYMYDTRPADVAIGIGKLVTAVLAMLPAGAGKVAR
ncbi:MAG: isoprenoid biosynthesis glyoxalase ElbB [Planctomycetes bacterium]|nr:isoprenoid biosynthesis glyoxalase ElbB [Planctomycetota bacterium]